MHTLTAFALALGVVLLVELPDKTLVATLVLSTRYRVRPVLVGVTAAFAVQCVIAATAGGLLTLLPRRGVEAVVAVLFALGAVLLLREAFGHEDEEEPELAAARENAPTARIVATAFGVLFAAEWGDASQIATAGLVARHHDIASAVATGLGAFVALVTVAVLAAYLGRSLVKRIPLHLIHGIAGVLFAVFAVIAAVSAARA
jgi:putative Ca2+/H+ antiporter (TMEM165/GDT1 family)